MDGDRQAHTQEEDEMKKGRNGRITNKKGKVNKLERCRSWIRSTWDTYEQLKVIIKSRQ
jgi:hypothetical protein